jgi:hypothetical protein
MIASEVKWYKDLASREGSAFCSPERASKIQGKTPLQEANKISLAGRVRLVLSAGALPGTVLSGVGDFFSPVGGWLLPLLAGTMAGLVFLFLLLRGRTPESVRKTANASKETQGIFEGPLLKQPGIWALFAFACIGILVGLWSHSDSRRGGVLASNIPIVSDAQQVTGLMKESLEEQRATRIAVQHIDRTGKKETSEDPRKELANQGIAWNANGIEDSIRNGDATTLELFIRGGMKVPDHFFDMALNRFDPEVIDVLQSNPSAVRSSDCTPAGRHLSQQLDTDAKLKFYAGVCNRPEVVKNFRSELARLSEEIDRQVQANKSVASDRAACIDRITREWPLTKLSRVAFPGEIDGNATIGDIPEELVASKVSQYLLMPRMPGEDVDDNAFYQNAVTQSCNQFYAVRDIDRTEASAISRVLEAF